MHRWSVSLWAGGFRVWLGGLLLVVILGVGSWRLFSYPQQRIVERGVPVPQTKEKKGKTDEPDKAAEWRALALRERKWAHPSGWYSQSDRTFARYAGSSTPGTERSRHHPGSLDLAGAGKHRRAGARLVIDPTNPNRMFAGSVSGGIWRSLNGGASWQPVDDFMANLAVTTLVMDPGNPNVIYAGTGEGFLNNQANFTDYVRGAGIFKTTDGGDTWNQLSNTGTPDYFYVNRLAIDPNNSNILLVATNTGIFRTSDAGLNWSPILPSGIRVQDIDFHPTNSNLVIASGGNFTRYSTNGGLDWYGSTGIPGGVGRIEIAYAPGNPSIVYASVDTNEGMIYRSTNGGQSYTLASQGSYLYLGGADRPSQGWYDNIIWVDPTNVNILVVGGVDLWRSLDGGATLTRISAWDQNGSVHADHHIIVSHPNYDGVTNRSVYFGNDGGLYRTSNIHDVALLTGWQELNNNLGITQFYGVAGNPTSGVVIAGAQDNGTVRYTGNTETWTELSGGDGGFTASDPADPNIFYSESQWLGLVRSNDGGASSIYMFRYAEYNGSQWVWYCRPLPYVIPEVCPQLKTANFIAPFILDPNNSNRLLAGGTQLWRTNDAKAPMTNIAPGGPSWQSIKSTIGIPASPISALAVAQGNPDIIWVGHNNSYLYKTSNGTAAPPAWSANLNTQALPDRYITRIAIDPNNHNVVYVAFGGFNSDNVWRTTDGGLTWASASGGSPTSSLPPAPVRSLAIHPGNTGWLYAGTEVGIFTSQDGGQTWEVPARRPRECLCR